MIRETLLAMLDGSTFASAIMPWHRPAPIRLPNDPAERAAMIEAHLRGRSGDVLYCRSGHKPEQVHIDHVALAAFNPAADGRCRWLVVDLDGADHGSSGLADPAHAARVIAERADAVGLGSGLLVARSRGGLGRHVFLFPPDPVPLADGVLALAALVAQAYRIASQDVADYSGPHAFRRADGSIAEIGRAGAVEPIPRGTTKPAMGWPIALPAAGAFASNGGGLVVDAFTDQPTDLSAVPACDAGQWTRFLSEARAHLQRIPAKPPAHVPSSRRNIRAPLNRLDPRTKAFLAGRVAVGTRNTAAFAASANLLGCGVEEPEAERLILAGAAACGLPEREARTAFSSAVGVVRRRCRR